MGVIKPEYKNGIPQITFRHFEEDYWDRHLVHEVVEYWSKKKAIRHMQDPSGYFYYQKHRFYTNKISYMRWSNAFMFNALSLYLLHSSDK